MTNKVQFTLGTEKVVLPSFEGSEVIIKKITVGKQREITNKVGAKDSLSPEAQQATLEMIVASIVSWNFYIEDEPVQVTVETIDQLPEQDFMILLEKVTGKDFSNDLSAKKKG